MFWWQWLVVFIVGNFPGMFIISIVIGCASYSSPFHKLEGFEFMNPLWWYKNTSVNPFGAVICALGFTAICPIAALGYWFYKLCTVGRKK